MKGDILLTPKEARRWHVLEQLLRGALTVPQAAHLLGLSERQVQRLKGGLTQHGPAALAHKNRGRTPQHAIPPAVRQRIVELAQTAFQGASCQHMAELLAQEGIQVSAKCVARILRAAGIPLPHTHRAPKRRRCRERMPQEGLLIQMDASPHPWLEDRAAPASLHGAIDDATGKILGLYFRPQEQILGYLQVLQQILTQHGIPISAYTDRHSLFVSPQPRQLSLQEELEGRTVRLTQVGRILEQLGIAHAKALSPQGRGRIERLWQTLQERLVVELRLAGIRDYDAANRFLPQFIERFNRQFAVKPADPTPAWRPAPAAEQLPLLLAVRHERKASAGSTIRFQGTTYQLVDRHGRVVPLARGSCVAILESLDGSRRACHAGGTYDLRPLAEPPRAVDSSPPPARPVSPPPRPIPAPDHPWRRSYKQIPVAAHR